MGCPENKAQASSFTVYNGNSSSVMCSFQGAQWASHTGTDQIGETVQADQASGYIKTLKLYVGGLEKYVERLKQTLCYINIIWQ